MSKQDYKVFWWIEIYPYGYDRDCELRNIELMGVVTAESEDDAMDQVREDNEIIGDDFIGYPEPDYVDSHPDIEIVWTGDMSAELVLDLTREP
jgi:hypothetical protein